MMTDVKMFKSVKELIERCEAENKAIYEVMLEQEMAVTGMTAEEVYTHMDRNLQTMENALEEGLAGVTSKTGLTGGDAVLMKQYIESGQALAGNLVLDAVSKAVATNEVNAAMGKICATPTAGSAGVVPGVLFSLKNRLQLNRQDMLNFLLTSGAFGFVVANNASISGAAGGCQAEVGSASAMAAAAIVEAVADHRNNLQKVLRFVLKIC